MYNPNLDKNKYKNSKNKKNDYVYFKDKILDIVDDKIKI